MAKQSSSEFLDALVFQPLLPPHQQPTSILEYLLLLNIFSSLYSIMRVCSHSTVSIPNNAIENLSLSEQYQPRKLINKDTW